MVVVSQKIGTLCIDYRPPDTVTALCYDAGMFSEEDCDAYLLLAKFETRFVPLIPVYYLDERCFSQMRIKCFSIFDALDFAEHLSISEFELKFVASKLGPLSDENREELDIVSVFFSGSLNDKWAMRINVAQKSDFIFSSNYADSASKIKSFKSIYERNCEIPESYKRIRQSII